MGLLRGFVFALDRRAVLAVLAIAVSVGYALVAGATVSGLKDAQDALGADIQQTRWLAEGGNGDAFALSRLPGDPTHGVARLDDTSSEHPIYTVYGSDGPVENASRGLAGPSTGLEGGDVVHLAGGNLTIDTGPPAAGARNDAIGVHSSVYERLGGEPDRVGVAVYDQLSDPVRSQLVERGFVVNEAPGAVPFYVAGADELVSAIAVTVASSTLVVGLLASGFVTMELRAKRESLATVQMYGGTRLVRRLVAGRGTVLLAGGHAVGLGLVVGLVEIVSRASSLDLALSWTFTGGALAATFLGGLLGLVPPLVTASRKLEAEEFRQDAPPSWLPQPLRLTLTNYRVLVPLAASAMILAASLGVIFGVVDLPGQLFGTQGQEVIADTDGNPLRGSVEGFTGLHLAKVEGFTGSSPEIFAPTRVEGASVMARGVDWAALGTMSDVTLAEGRLFQAPDEALAGQRLAHRLNLEPGDRLSLPASYSPATVTVQVTGVVESQSLLGDELLVPLSTGRALTGLAPDKVSMVRYASQTSPNATAGASSQLPTGVEVTDLTVTPEDPVPFQPATVQADLVNFASNEQTRHLTLSVDGEPVDDAWPTLGPKSTGTAQMEFTVPRQGDFTLEVNPTRKGSTGEAAYRIETLDTVRVNGTLSVRVLDRQGNAAPDVTVTFDEDRDVTDPQGRARLEPRRVGNHTLLADGPSGRAARPVLVVPNGSLYRSHPSIETVSGPLQVDAGDDWQGVVEVTNVGGVTHNGTVRLPVNDTRVNLTGTRIPSGRTVRIPASLDLPTGQHEIGPRDARLEVTVGDPGAQAGDGDGAGGSGPSDGDGGDGTGGGGSGGSSDETGGKEASEIERLLELRRSRARSSTEEAGQSATQAFLGDTFENLNAALTIITLATVLHAGLVTTVAVFREVEEHTSAVGSLSAIGASAGALRARAGREFAIVGGAAALLGTVAGLFLSSLGARMGLLTGFGHALFPRLGIGFGIRVGLASLAVTVVVAVLAIERARSRRTGQLLTEGPARANRPPLDALIGGSE